jgi:hypothetical protein
MTPEEIAVSALAKLNDNIKRAEEDSGKVKGKRDVDGKAKGSLKPAPSGGKNSKVDSSSDDQKKVRRTRKAFKFTVEPIVIQKINKGRGHMNHSYRDFSRVPAELDWEAPKSIEDMTFAEKVHDLLSDEEHAKYISWMPHGRSFKVIVPVIFERNVCERYFGHKRYSSFLRQLSNHGFKHLTKGNDRNCYYHEVS